MRRLVSILALWLLCCSFLPSGGGTASIGTPVSLGGGAANSAGCLSGFTFTTGADSPAGSSIVLMVGGGNGAYTISDQVGNSYSSVVSASNTTVGQLFIASNITDLPSGDTISVKKSAGSNGCAAAAFSVTGLTNSSPTDVTNSSTTNTNTPSVAVTTTHAVDLVVGGSFSTNGSGALSAQSSGFTALTGAAGAAGTLIWAYQSVTSTGTYTYAPTFTSMNAGTVTLVGALKSP